jgi:putative NADH-flavin reductase
MKLALIGATGNVGSQILAQAERRGHKITAIARRIERVEATPNVHPVKGDATDESALAGQLSGHDAVISATKFIGADAGRLLRAVKAAGVPRLLVVGGAGSLEVAPGVALVDTPQFPAEYKEEALAGRAFLTELQRETELNWTFLSPSAFLSPGEPTGKFRLGTNQLLVGANGESRISVGDFAVAMVDELERNAHPRQRFTVGY